MGSYSVCSFVSDLFHLVQCLQVLSMSHMHVSEVRFFLRLNNTPLSAHTTFTHCLSIHPLMDTGAVSSFGSSENPHCGHCHKNRLASVFSCLYYLWIPTNLPFIIFICPASTIDTPMYWGTVMLGKENYCGRLDFCINSMAVWIWISLFPHC